MWAGEAANKLNRTTPNTVLDSYECSSSSELTGQELDYVLHHYVEGQMSVPGASGRLRETEKSVGERKPVLVSYDLIKSRCDLSSSSSGSTIRLPVT